MTKRSAFVITLMVGIGLGLWRPSKALAASLYFSPSGKTVTAGSNVSVALKVSAEGQAINAAEATIIFSSDHLQLLSISKNTSIFSFWAVQPSGSNGTGRITFSGGLASPGYGGSSGTIITLTFRAATVGQGNISISGAKVLANDGEGTDVLSTVNTASITVSAAPTPAPAPPTNPSIPTIASANYPDQNAWYRDGTANLSWTKPAGATGFSFHLSQDPNDVPDHQIDQATTSTVVALPADGVWYVAVQADAPSGWSATAHFRLQYDHTAPPDFALTILRDRGVNDPTPQVQFSATDVMSGIDHYSVVVDNGAAEADTSPVTLTGLSTGSHTVTVTAFDKAGNWTTSHITVDQVGYPAPKIDTVTSPLVLLDHIVVSGTATAGDTVTVYVSGQSIGQVIAGQADPAAVASGVVVRSPWSLQSSRVFRPGRYAVTAVATGPDGQVSVASDPIPLLVTGHSILLGGQVIATFSAAPIAAVVVICLAVLITWVMMRLLLAVKNMHDHDLVVEEEVDVLRRQVRRRQVTASQVDQALETIERDLEQPRRRSRARRAPRRR